MEYMIRVIRSGKVEEKTIFPINPNTKTRKPKSKGSLKRKQDSNERDGIKRFTRLINCNYEAGDLFITLNYDRTFSEDLNKAFAEADREGSKFIDRLRYRMAKAGIEPKMILITSDMDGDTGEYKAPHHHLLIKNEGFEFKNGKLYCAGKPFETIWKNGGTSFETLRNQDSYAQLAAYMYRQVRRIKPGEFKYHASKNLKKPELVYELITHSNRKLRLPKGAKLIAHSDPNFTPEGVQYIAYIRKENMEVKGHGLQKGKPVQILSKKIC